MATRRVRFLFTGEGQVDPVLRRIGTGFRGAASSANLLRTTLLGLVGSQAIRGLIDLQNEIERTSDLADALDIDPDFAETAQRAFEDAGGSAEQFADAFGNLQANIKRGLDLDEASLDAFRDFGVDFAELRKLSPAEIFDEVLAGARQLSGVARTQPLRQLFGGDTGARLVAGVAEETESLIALQQELAEAGLLTSAGARRAAEEQSEAIRETKREFGTAASEILGGINQIARDSGALDLGFETRGLQGEAGERARGRRLPSDTQGDLTLIVTAIKELGADIAGRFPGPLELPEKSVVDVLLELLQGQRGQRREQAEQSTQIKEAIQDAETQNGATF
jgi:hypothetical protein